MAVSISVPIAEAVPDEGLYLQTELEIGAFTPAAKKVLHRVFAGMLAAETTLASGAPVNSLDRVFAWFAEEVAANE